VSTTDDPFFTLTVPEVRAFAKDRAVAPKRDRPLLPPGSAEARMKGVDGDAEKRREPPRPLQQPMLATHDVLHDAVATAA